jgi:hypothetical protein
MVTPSSVKVTVPEGDVAAKVVGMTVAVNCKELPAVGVLVGAVNSSVVGIFATVKGAGAEVPPG